MRHRRKTQNLSRFSSYYKATIRSLARAVIINQKIVTTKVRAKLARVLVDNLVTLGKQIDSLAARRRAFSFLNDHSLVHKLFSDIGPSFAQKNGGYTRIIPFKRRRGDNAELVVLELSVMKPAIAKEKKEKPAVENVKEKQVKAIATESVRSHKAEHNIKAEKPSKKSSGGLGRIFKSKRDSL